MVLSNRRFHIYQIRDALLYWIGIPAAVTGSGRLLDFALKLPALPQMELTRWAAPVLMAAGLLLILRAIRDLASFGGGTPNIRRPPIALVKEGVYGICRHPMFLGYDLAGMAVVLWFGSPAMLTVSYPLFICLQIRFLLKEEHCLRRKYRNHYRDYSAHVPFLIPYALFRRNSHDQN